MLTMEVESRCQRLSDSPAARTRAVCNLAAALGAAVVLAGCHDTAMRTVTSPTSPSTSTPVSSAVPAEPVRGIVYEVTEQGRQPLEGVGIDVSVEFQSWPPVTFSDPDGRFRTMAANSPTLKIVGTKPNYSQPCRFTASGMDVDHEVYMVANDIVASSGLPSSYPISPPVLTGRILEQTSSGDQPVAGASITLDFTGGDGWAPSATTVSDAEGRYLLCNVVNAANMGFALLVAKAGYADRFVVVGRSVPPAFDVVLTRR